MTALYREPWFTELAYRTSGRGYTVHAAARARAEERGGVLPHSDLHLVFVGLPSRTRQEILEALLTLGLWSEVPGGFQVHAPSSGCILAPANQPLDPFSSPRPVAAVTTPSEERLHQRREVDRRRQQRHRQKRREAPEPTSQQDAREHGRHAPESAVTPSVTAPVTLPSRADEDDLSLSDHPFFKMEDGEERMHPPGPSARPGVTSSAQESAPNSASPLDLPATTTAPTAAAPAAALGTSSPAPSVTLDSQVVTLWSQAIGQPEHTVSPRDRDAVARCLAAGATLDQFHAAIAHVAKTEWYQQLDDNGIPRNRLAVICGKRFEEHVRKGMAPRPGLASGARPGVAPPPPVLPSEPLRRRYQATHPAFVGADRESPRLWAGYFWMWSYSSERWEMQGRDPNAQEVA